MPTKEKGKAHTWMNEKKRNGRSGTAKTKATRQRETQLRDAKKGKTQQCETYVPGQQERNERASWGTRTSDTCAPGSKNTKKAAMRNARPREKQTRNTHETHGPGRQRTQGTGTEKFAPRGWKWALGILTPQPSKNKAHI